MFETIYGKPKYTAGIRKIIIKRGALKNLTQLPAQISLGLQAVMICDANTYQAAGQQVESQYARAALPLKTCLLEGKDHLVPDDKALGSVLLGIDQSVGYLIAVGSGTINDITRFVAHRLSLPFISVPTAPSMDGYASSVSPLIIDGLKTTLAAKTPLAILADLEVLAASPAHMKSAGFGDLMGKVTARVDWHLSHILNGEELNGDALTLIAKALNRCLQAVKRDNLFSDEAIVALMEGLIVSGLAIALVGSSRPASGSEHMISHFLEMKALRGEAPEYLHGEKVALGTFLIGHLYHRVFRRDFDEIQRLSKSKAFAEQRGKREVRIRRTYGPLAEVMITRWRTNLPTEERLKYIGLRLSNKWEELRRIVSDSIPKPPELVRLFNQVGVPYHPGAMGFASEQLEDALICAKEMHTKYSLLNLLDELGLLEFFTRELLDDLRGLCPSGTVRS